ncbi:hypothetical protein HELRODRAFT_164848 [Helobdella robusta]|uniref:Uncharacterized protein n=1 Tax=Helobdella robusta TaxID=6412 RepID=T1EVW0_HELRO|nr:hypothetical protein HELRODRAFT_164848 [Helobdella robusta]ESN92748.1 hypothetical protein HELRODRAFT_164848 [Helobdella robusta]
MAMFSCWPAYKHKDKTKKEPQLDEFLVDIRMAGLQLQDLQFERSRSCSMGQELDSNVQMNLFNLSIPSPATSPPPPPPPSSSPSLLSSSSSLPTTSVYTQFSPATRDKATCNRFSLNNPANVESNRSNNVVGSSCNNVVGSSCNIDACSSSNNVENNNVCESDSASVDISQWTSKKPPIGSKSKQSKNVYGDDIDTSSSHNNNDSNSFRRLAHNSLRKSSTPAALSIFPTNHENTRSTGGSNGNADNVKTSKKLTKWSFFNRKLSASPPPLKTSSRSRSVSNVLAGMGPASNATRQHNLFGSVPPTPSHRESPLFKFSSPICSNNNTADRVRSIKSATLPHATLAGYGTDDSKYRERGEKNVVNAAATSSIFSMLWSGKNKKKVAEKHQLEQLKSSFFLSLPRPPLVLLPSPSLETQDWLAQSTVNSFKTSPGVGCPCSSCKMAAKFNFKSKLEMTNYQFPVRRDRLEMEDKVGYYNSRPIWGTVDVGDMNDGDDENEDDVIDVNGIVLYSKCSKSMNKLSTKHNIKSKKQRANKSVQCTFNHKISSSSSSNVTSDSVNNNYPHSMYTNLNAVKNANKKLLAMYVPYLGGSKSFSDAEEIEKSSLKYGDSAEFYSQPRRKCESLESSSDYRNVAIHGDDNNDDEEDDVIKMFMNMNYDRPSNISKNLNVMDNMNNTISCPCCGNTFTFYKYPKTTDIARIGQERHQHHLQHNPLSYAHNNNSHNNNSPINNNNSHINNNNSHINKNIQNINNNNSHINNNNSHINNNNSYINNNNNSLINNNNNSLINNNNNNSLINNNTSRINNNNPLVPGIDLLYMVPPPQLSNNQAYENANYLLWRAQKLEDNFYYNGNRNYGSSGYIQYNTTSQQSNNTEPSENGDYSNEMKYGNSSNRFDLDITKYEIKFDDNNNIIPTPNNNMSVGSYIDKYEAASKNNSNNSNQNISNQQHNKIYIRPRPMASADKFPYVWSSVPAHNNFKNNNNNIRTNNIDFKNSINNNSNSSINQSFLRREVKTLNNINASNNNFNRYSSNNSHHHSWRATTTPASAGRLPTLNENVSTCLRVVDI